MTLTKPILKQTLVNNAKSFTISEDIIDKINIKLSQDWEYKQSKVTIDLFKLYETNGFRRNEIEQIVNNLKSIYPDFNIDLKPSTMLEFS